MEREGRRRVKIAVVVGTRPEAIKLAPVILSLRKHSAKFDPVVIATAQHRELLDQALSLFGITPDLDLNLMSSLQKLPALTARVIEAMSEALALTEPDLVLVQGDTTTAFAAALAAFYQKIPVCHVEAGLRSNDKYSPFPEEINRRLVTTVADIHFAPTPHARSALLREGVPTERTVITGNTVVDALLHVADSPFVAERSELKGLDLEGHPIVLVTAHRRESWGMELENICNAIKEISEERPEVRVIYPVHPNPAVKDVAEQILSGNDRVYMVKPLDYLTFVNVMKMSRLILTDSGGLQEEAPTFGKPLLLMRNLTERPEAFDLGWSKIVGTDRQTIVRETVKLLDDADFPARMHGCPNPYGDGRASERIVLALSRWREGEHPLLTRSEELN